MRHFASIATVSRARFAGLALVALAWLPGTGCTLIGNAIGAEKRQTYELERPPDVSQPAFRRSMATFGTGLVGGNAVELLTNGDEFFPAMLAAIGNAKRSVNFEIYKFKNDVVGRLFGDALMEAARRGVEVRVLADATGSKLGDLRDEMLRAGVRVASYRPVRPWTLHKIGRRTHRKMLVVDGTVSFTGGYGIDDRWLGDGGSANEWRDVAVKVTGPVTAQVQALFAENWTFTTGEILAGEAFYPAVKPAGDVLAQAIGISADDELSRANLLYYLAIRSARKSIHIQNAYFFPDRQVREALAQAARGGVDVKVMVPGRNMDKPALRTASRMYYGPLLKAGVKIYEYDTSMLHNKVLVVDGVFSAVGSVNVDSRSRKYNSEQSLAFHDVGFAARLEQMFEDDLAGCRDVSYEDWKDRGFDAKVAEKVLSLGRAFY